MPVYVYECFCGKRKEEFRKIDERHIAPKCHGPMELRIMPTSVAVFTPYQAIGAEKEGGKRPWIKNAAEHREYLRRNGYEEVGNDKSMAPRAPREVGPIETHDFQLQDEDVL
jgi:hypothetical protein